MDILKNDLFFVEHFACRQITKFSAKDRVSDSPGKHPRVEAMKCGQSLDFNFKSCIYKIDLKLLLHVYIKQLTLRPRLCNFEVNFCYNV